MKIIVKDRRGSAFLAVEWTKGLRTYGGKTSEIDLRDLCGEKISNYGLIEIDLCGIDLRHRFDESRSISTSVGFAATVEKVKDISGDAFVYCTLADPDEYPYLVEHLSKNLRLAA